MYAIRYVYNHIMYARWVLDDAVSAVNAKILELTPSLLGAVTTIQPSVAFVADDPHGPGVAGDAGQFLRARAWRDAGFEQRHPVQICVHVVVASIAERPLQFQLQLGGLCDSGGAGCQGQAHNATHLFNQHYTVAVRGGSSSEQHTMTDTIMPGASSIYAIGCDTWQAQPANLVNDPGFEASELPLTPGFLTCAEEAQYPMSTFKGKCKVEDKHAGSWGLPQQRDLRDGRAAFFVDSRLPHSGRHSGRVWLPSAVPVTMGIPGHTTNLDGAHIANGTEYEVELWARSFPPGMSVAITVGSWQTLSAVPSSPLGLRSFTRYQPAVAIEQSVILSGNWSRVRLVVPKGLWPPQTSFNLQFGVAAGVFPSGSVWLDDVAIRNSTAISDSAR